AGAGGVVRAGQLPAAVVGVGVDRALDPDDAGPTTGGYPVIAVVRAADLPAAAQALPGTQVRFLPVRRRRSAGAFR
ncbi:hypothetical protein ABZ398_31540, partial [Streptomyces sp. NPDC005890]